VTFPWHSATNLIEERPPDLDKKKTSRTAFEYSTIGIQLAITVIAFVFGGYKLDEYFHSSPVFISIGAFLGMAIGFYHLIKQLKDIEKSEKRDKNKERKKWL
jgi:F0F1-type ATP synthase assembly protein I